MLVTKNVDSTLWMFQAPHMGEQAATVGRGLMNGYIYWRYAFDFLQEGERILREEYFIELSDGSKYPLGEGAASAKITIVDLGSLPGGEVGIEVIGKPEVGVGVSRVLYSAVVEYDDGKVPVLDTDQLNGILAELNDNLEQSMVNTAEAVKAELRQEVSNAVIDGKTYCDTKANEVETRLSTKVDTLRTEVTNHVSTLRSETDTKIATAKTEIEADVRQNIDAVTRSLEEAIDTAKDGLNQRIDNVSNDLTSARDELSRRITKLMETTSKICGWGHSGYFTARDDNWVNFIGGAAGDITGNTEMISRSGNYFKVNGGAKPYDREFRVSVTGSITFIGAGDVSERVRFAARKKDNTTICQTGQYFVATGTTGDLTYNNVQFELTMRIHANDETNPLLTDGITVSFGRIGRQQVRLTNPGVTCVLTGTL